MIDYRYWAGFLDGEGSFYVATGNCVLVEVSNTYQPIIRKLEREVGGTVIPCKSGKINHRPYYKWIISGKRADKFIRKVHRYLVEKKKQAELLLEFNKLPKSSRWYPVSKKIRDKKLFIIKELKRLKHISY